MNVLNRADTSIFRALLPEGRERFVLAAVGSGGKTTLLTALAEEAAQRRIPTLLTTTTHMYRTPEAELSGEAEPILARLARGEVCFCGLPAPEGKLTALPSPIFQRLLAHCALALVEADGSRGLPLKWPSETEPVLPPETDHIALVCGMSALGGRLRDVCHRWDRSGLNGETRVTPSVIAEILRGGYLRRLPTERCTLILHQCDTPARVAAAHAVAEQLHPQRCLLTRRSP